MTRLEKKFKEIVKGKNFVTPIVVEYVEDGDYIMEISKGNGIFDGIMYGVSVANTITKKHEYALCKGGFLGIDEAKNYIATTL